MLPSGLPEDVEDDENLARFLTQSSHFSSTVVKAPAFLPDSRQETSVFRLGLEPPSQFWDLGREAAGNRALRGAAIFKARSVRELGLRVDPDEPPPRHAAIRGWPTYDDPDKRKAESKRLALGLARAAELHLVPQ
jgi:hypothetical protein